MSNKNDRWSALSMSERAEVFKMGIKKGIKNRKTIIDVYNSFGDGGDTDSTVYYDDTPIETPVVKAFNSKEEYNRYYGEQFGKKVAEGMNNAAPYVLEAAMLPFTISGAVETPMLLYQGVKAAPQLIRGAKTLLTKGKKALGKKVLGMVDDMNGYVKEGSHFRIVDKPAIDDAIESGLIRAKTGLHHDAVTYLKNNFSDYLKDIPGWDRMDANDLRGILESKGAFNNGGDALRREAMLQIRNSTNHGGSVHYFKGMPYPNYEITPTNYIIETPENIGSFVAGHGGKEFIDMPLENAGSTLLKTNGSVKGASIPSKGSSYWEYSPFWEMWKNNKFSEGGRILDGKTDGTQTLSGFPVRRDTLPFKGYFNVEDTLLYSPSESTKFDSVTPMMVMQKDSISEGVDPNFIDNIINGPKFSVPEDNPERTFVKKANDIIKDKSEEDLRKELKSKTEDEVRDIQRQLADEGHYDIELFRGKSANAGHIQKILVKEGYLTNKDVDNNIGDYTTEKLQEMLVDKGYLPEFTESGKTNIDGDIGKRTREAFKQFYRDYNVDGIAGNKTVKGYLAKEGKKSLGFNMNVSAEGMVDQCAAWVSKKYDSVVGASKQNGVYGSAWNMLKNVEDSGGQMLFNAYDSSYFDNVKDASGIKKGVMEYMKSNPIDYSILEAGDVVGIHNPSSTHYGEVLKEGTTYNTHVGIVVGVEDGVPIVEHNILGKVRRERIDKLTGSAFGKPVVTAASRPKQGAPLEGTLEFKDVKSNIELPSKPNELMSEYMDSVASSKETFGKIYEDVDMDFIEKAAIAVTKRETGFMTNKQSDVLRGSAGVGSMGTAALRKVAHWLKDTPEEVISQDLTKMKFNSLSSQYRKAIGLESPEQLSTDPTITGRAVTLLLSKNYDYFQRLAKKHPELGLTKEDIQNATIWSYNTGLGALATLGFEGQGEHKGEYRPEEIERLRAISQPGYKEKDIRATNLKYLGALGEWYYDNFGNPYTPYVAAANETMGRLGTKKMYGGINNTFKSVAEINARKLSSKTLK